MSRSTVPRWTGLLAITDTVGRAVATGAIGGAAGLVGPDGCFPSDIPTPITPYVREAEQGLRAADLPRIRAELGAALAAVEKAETGLTPSGAQAGALIRELEGALEELRGRQ